MLIFGCIQLKPVDQVAGGLEPITRGAAKIGHGLVVIGEFRCGSLGGRAIPSATHKRCLNARCTFRGRCHTAIGDARVRDRATVLGESKCTADRGNVLIGKISTPNWRDRSCTGSASLKQRKGDPVQAELDSAMKRIGELTMQVELLEAKTETFGPLGRRRSRR